MSVGHDTPLLANYHLLVSRIDELCRRITDRFAAAIRCAPGCSSCCRHLTLFPVEAAALEESLVESDTALDGLDGDSRQADHCPLLRQEVCLAYPLRPVICRTHGLPLLTVIDGERRIDCCPENFRGVESLPGDAVIDLETLNRTLVAVNARFVAETDDPFYRTGERIAVAAVIARARARRRGPAGTAAADAPPLPTDREETNP
jgi:hypothetical protein